MWVLWVLNYKQQMLSKTDLETWKTAHVKSIYKAHTIQLYKNSRAAVGTEFLSPYPPHTHTHTHGNPHTNGRPEKWTQILYFLEKNLWKITIGSFTTASNYAYVVIFIAQELGTLKEREVYTLLLRRDRVLVNNGDWKQMTHVFYIHSKLPVASPFNIINLL